MSVEGMKIDHFNSSYIGEFKKLFAVVTNSKNNLILDGPAV